MRELWERFLCFMEFHDWVVIRSSNEAWCERCHCIRPLDLSQWDYEQRLAQRRGEY